jgi:rhombotail lipoprotein
MRAPALLAGCETAPKERSETSQGDSVMQYLLPDQADKATMQDAEPAALRVPLRIGVSFVPPPELGASGATQAKRQQMLAQVVKAFENYPFVSELKPIPSTYLGARRGFADLNRVAGIFAVVFVELLSYDRAQSTEKTRDSFWYWTLVSACTVQCDRYDVHTRIEASVVDVKSRRLHLRAAGTSLKHGGAAMSNVAAATRAARGAGFQNALENLIPELQAALEAFRQRTRTGKEIGEQLQLPQGYGPGASRPARRGSAPQAIRLPAAAG